MWIFPSLFISLFVNMFLKIDKLISKVLNWFTIFYQFIKLVWTVVRSYTHSLYSCFFPPELKSLKNEIALVTGAGNGIGKEVCLELAAQGIKKIICWDDDKLDNDNITRELNEMGVNAFGFEIDVARRVQVEFIASKIKREIGDVTLLINCASINPPQNEFLSHSSTSLEQLVQTNVLAYMWLLREFLPSMISSNYGHIATICSIDSLLPSKNAPSCAMKHALHGLIESLNQELEDNIKFTTIYSIPTNYYNLIPYLTKWKTHPREIAQQLVDGLRRNYEHIYVPQGLKYFVEITRMLHPTARRAILNFMTIDTQFNEVSLMFV